MKINAGFAADVDRLNLAAVLGQQTQLLGLSVRHDDAHERLAGHFVPRIDRNRRERCVRAAVHVLAKLLVYVRELLSQLDAPLPEMSLHVDEAHPPGCTHVPPIVTRQRSQYQRVRAASLHAVHDGRITVTTVLRLMQASSIDAVCRFGAETLVQVQLDAFVHQVPFPLHRPRARHFALHAHGHVEHEPRVRIVRLAQPFERVLQLRPVDDAAAVRPFGVGRVALQHVVVAAAPDELVGQLDAGEVTLDRAPSVGQVTAPADGGQPLNAPVVRLDRVNNRLAQRSGAPVQARLPVVLPVRPSATLRAIHVIAVVTHLERAPRFRDGRQTLTLRVPATDRSRTAAITAAATRNKRTRLLRRWHYLQLRVT